MLSKEINAPDLPWGAVSLPYSSSLLSVRLLRAEDAKESIQGDWEIFRHTCESSGEGKRKGSEGLSGGRSSFVTSILRGAGGH
jgi:hypothetical protein